EIFELLVTPANMHDAGGDGFDAQAADGHEAAPAHGLRGEMGRELRNREGVDALASRLESGQSQLAGRGTRGRKNQDFGLFAVVREKNGGALEEPGVGAGLYKRARGHKQLY